MIVNILVLSHIDSNPDVAYISANILVGKFRVKFSALVTTTQDKNYLTPGLKPKLQHSSLFQQLV